MAALMSSSVTSGGLAPHTSKVSPRRLGNPAISSASCHHRRGLIGLMNSSGLFKPDTNDTDRQGSMALYLGIIVVYIQEFLQSPLQGLPSTKAFSLDLEVKMLQQTKGLLMASSNGQTKH